ncbi:MAG: HDIG domain-containing protein [bacterium]|nr:HDIG domain-containing protein [bacterium]
MNKTLRYGLILTAIITGINLVFYSIAFAINLFLVENITTRIILIVFPAILSGGLIAYFIVSSSPIFREYLTTFRRLLRLESLSHPLMVRFSHEAPGTYHHTLTVANISSRAAKTINADSLLTRVGAYYHDIGKIVQPDFFVENQSSSQNIHDQIENPEESAQIIINHVTNGVEIAKENHLPQEVINFIQQHHGTSTVSYFYEKSKQDSQKTKKADFKYPGPKPQSAEIAIVMLADTLEAAVRSESDPTLTDIREIVNQAIEQKTNEGQLDNAALSAKQISKLRRSFIESLNAIFHQRIQYPKENTK